ncbi:MAG: DNA-directed RNA polymerase subunit delta [Bacilli bacterium]
MEIFENESMIDVAVRVMKTKKKPKSLKELTNEILQAKGIKNNAEELKAQFQMDFMLSGYFVCCGEDKNGLKLWDLKSRQPSTLLDKDGNYLEDLYENDEDVVRNELKDDYDYDPSLHKNVDEIISDDEEEETEETDDIEEELGLVEVDADQDVSITEEVIVEKPEEDEDVEEEDEIEQELKK